jgi:hypothetical protein
MVTEVCQSETHHIRTTLRTAPPDMSRTMAWIEGAICNGLSAMFHETGTGISCWDD